MGCPIAEIHEAAYESLCVQSVGPDKFLFFQDTRQGDQ